MNTPGFTAEASLDNRNSRYDLTLEHSAEAGRVLPQGLNCRSDEGGITCTFCWDEGGFSGCFSHRIPRLTKF
ncbi:MAG TPA: hypothetical protein VN861_19000 [Candidatus Acidoferrales bacterium]|nr:hypothetical protein [Candidatus Acidoferrales bacterium]